MTLLSACLTHAGAQGKWWVADMYSSFRLSNGFFHLVDANIRQRKE